MAATFRKPGRIELDDGPRVVALANDVESAYRRAGVLERYRSMSYSHQREYNLWIEEAKQAETRKRRIEKAMVDIRAKPAKK